MCERWESEDEEKEEYFEKFDPQELNGDTVLQ